MTAFPYIFIFTFLILVTIYIILGFRIYDMLTRIPPNCESVFMEGKRDNTPAAFFASYGDNLVVEDTPYQMSNYETITFPTRDDNITIRGWFVPSAKKSEKIVIVVHGLRMCRRDPTVLLPAGMLHRHGYNVLLPDLRNHGDSEVTDGRTAAGNREYRDVLGAFDYLLERGFKAENIAIVGISLGGGAALIAFGEEPRLAAIWVDSAFADIQEAVEDELRRNKLPTFLACSTGVITRITGIDLYEHSPLKGIQKHNNRPIFLTHGAGDLRLKADFTHDLYAAAGSNAELWIVEEADHVQAIYRIPDEYEKRMIAFFDRAFAN